MSSTAIPQTAQYVRGQDRQYLMNGTGAATAVGDLLYLDTSAVGKVTDPIAGTVATGTDFYKVRQGVNEDISSGIPLVCLEVIANGKCGLFAESGEVMISVTAAAVALGNRLMPVSITGTLASTAKAGAAAAGNVKVVAVAKEGNGSAPKLIRAQMVPDLGYLGA